MTACSAAAAATVAHFVSSAFRSELYARRPQPLLAGWRDAAEQALLGKELANEQDGRGRVFIHQEGCLARHNGRHPDHEI